MVRILGDCSYGQCVFSTAVGQSKAPNIVCFLVDNLGMGELSSYSGGPFRGVASTRIDAFAGTVCAFRSPACIANLLYIQAPPSSISTGQVIATISNAGTSN